MNRRLRWLIGLLIIIALIAGIIFYPPPRSWNGSRLVLCAFSLSFRSVAYFVYIAF